MDTPSNGDLMAQARKEGTRKAAMDTDIVNLRIALKIVENKKGELVPKYMVTVEAAEQELEFAYGELWQCAVVTASRLGAASVAMPWGHLVDSKVAETISLFTATAGSEAERVEQAASDSRKLAKAVTGYVEQTDIGANIFYTGLAHRYVSENHAGHEPEIEFSVPKLFSTFHGSMQNALNGRVAKKSAGNITASVGHQRRHSRDNARRSAVGVTEIQSVWVRNIVEFANAAFRYEVAIAVDAFVEAKGDEYGFTELEFTSQDSVDACMLGLLSDLYTDRHEGFIRHGELVANTDIMDRFAHGRHLSGYLRVPARGSERLPALQFEA